LFVINRVRKDGTATVVVDPFLDLGEPLVTLSLEVLNAQVDQIDDGLGSDEEQAVEVFNIFGLPVTSSDPLALFEHFLDLHEKISFFLGVFIVESLDLGRKIVDSLVALLKILLDQFVADNFEISDGVDITFSVSDFLTFEASDNVEYTIDTLNVGKESISQTSTFVSTRDQTGNIDNIQDSGNLRFGLEDIAKLVESGIRDADLSNIGVNSTEREVFSGDIKFGEEVESGGFSDVGETNDTHLEGVTRTTEKRLLFRGSFLFGWHV